MKDDVFKKLLNELADGRAIGTPSNEMSMREIQATNIMIFIGCKTGHRANQLTAKYYELWGSVLGSFKLPLDKYLPREPQLSDSVLGRLSLIAALPGGNGR